MMFGRIGCLKNGRLLLHGSATCQNKANGLWLRRYLLRLNVGKRTTGELFQRICSIQLGAEAEHKDEVEPIAWKDGF